MGTIITLSVIFGFFTIFYGYSLGNANKDEKSIFMYCGGVGLMTIWGVYLLGFMGERKYETPNSLVFVAIIILSVALVLFLQRYLKKADMQIVTKQTNYWGIDAKKISNFYSYRKDIRADRVETKINKLSKKFYRKYGNSYKFITANIFYDMSKIKLTRVKTTKELEGIVLYDTIFSKIIELNLSAEKYPNYEEILKENDFIAEYFLMDCWCRFTKIFNIGLANLEILATTFTQKELVGAIDNADLNSVKRHGAGLYYMYAMYKGLIPKEEEVEEDFSDSNSDDGEDPDF